MNRAFKISVMLALSVMIWFQTADACSISFTPLRKEFRAAKSVFLGKVVKIEDYVPSETEKASIPESWRDWKLFSKVKFEVKNKWKGNLSETREFIAVSYYDCGCPGDADQFKEGEEFFVFASGKHFITVCDAWRTRFENPKQLTKKLDSFGFRTWARIYPF